MGRSEPTHKKNNEVVSRTLKLKLQQRQKFNPVHDKKRTPKPQPVFSDENQNVTVPEKVHVDTDELRLFQEIESKLAAVVPLNLEADYQAFKEQEARENPAKDPEVLELYTKIGELLRSYRSGKLPQSFGIIPLVDNWKALLELTEPVRWTPHAFYEAVKSFTSCAESDRTVDFNQLYLLPRVLKDVRETKQLNYHLFKALCRATYRPSSFFQGVLLAFMEQQDTTLRQAEILAAVLRRKSLPKLHVAAALFQAVDKAYNAPNNYIVKTLIDKKSSLPQTVINKLCEWFFSFSALERGRMPVMWHQTLLSFVRSYRKHIHPEHKKKLISLVKRKFLHEGISPEIVRTFHQSLPEERDDDDANKLEIE